MYKLVAIDLDDTLLNDHLEVTEGTKQALQAAIDQGVVVTLATGRMFASAKKIASQIGINVPLITCHGSLVKNMIFFKGEKIEEGRLGALPFLFAEHVLPLPEILVYFTSESHFTIMDTHSNEVDIPQIGTTNLYFSSLPF